MMKESAIAVSASAIRLPDTPTAAVNVPIVPGVCPEATIVKPSAHCAAETPSTLPPMLASARVWTLTPPTEAPAEALPLTKLAVEPICSDAPARAPADPPSLSSMTVGSPLSCTRA